MKKLICVGALLLLVLSVAAQCKCEYHLLAVGSNQSNAAWFDAGTVRDHNYSGIRIGYPFNGRVAHMDVQYGYAFKRVITSAIIGLYTSDFAETINLNVGVGVTAFYKKVVIGCTYTNMEGIGVKAGFYIGGGKKNK